MLQKYSEAGRSSYSIKHKKMTSLLLYFQRSCYSLTIINPSSFYRSLQIFKRRIYIAHFLPFPKNLNTNGITLSKMIKSIMSQNYYLLSEGQYYFSDLQ